MKLLTGLFTSGLPEPLVVATLYQLRLAMKERGSEHYLKTMEALSGVCPMYSAIYQHYGKSSEILAEIKNSDGGKGLIIDCGRRALTEADVRITRVMDYLLWGGIATFWSAATAGGIYVWKYPDYTMVYLAEVARYGLYNMLFRKRTVSN